jgi:5-formyltetrahydrofolate cyclo-ligase
MGRGKGFYDKLLPYIKCTTVGLAFDFQMVERIPCEEFDKPLDMVITED